MVMKIFEMPQRNRSTSHVHMDRGCGMSRERKVMRLAKSCSRHKSRDAPATSRICLQDINGAGVKHSLEIPRIIAILSSGNFDCGGSAIADQAEPSKIVG